LGVKEAGCSDVDDTENPQIEEPHTFEAQGRLFALLACDTCPRFGRRAPGGKPAPSATDMCGYWRAKWVHYMEGVGITNPRRAAIWVGHSTFRMILTSVADGNAEDALDEVAQGTRSLWEVGIGTEDLSQMITLYEETVNVWIRKTHRGDRGILRAAETFDRFFHAVFSLTFKTYSALDRGRTPRPTGLTKREEQILAGVGRGESSRTIASALKISPRTVEAVRERLKTKLHVKTIAELVRHAVQINLVDDRGQ